jgi:prepilin-type N-terminal cleavage/methylation domain-containing protein
MHSLERPRGLTLVELVIVVGIIAILVSLFIVGAMRVRESANIAESKNNVRQIVLGVHHFAAAHHGRLPTVGQEDAVDVSPTKVKPGKWAPALLVQILPYLEGDARTSKQFRPVPLFLSPSDPTVAVALAKSGHEAAVASYAGNAQLFKAEPHLPASLLDGASNTIAFAEHYAGNCLGISFPYWDEYGLGNGHRSTFADWGDITPVTHGNPPITMPSTAPNLGLPWPHTFQVAPRAEECRFALPQTPHSSGMIAGMADGGVRQIAPAISPAIFWGAVTPRSGEILDDF